MGKKYSKLFEPLKISNCTIKNRYVMAPMGPGGLCDAEGAWNQRGIQYYVERAKGGTGLIITGVSFVENKVENHPMPTMCCPTYNPVHFTRMSREMTERVHAYNSKIFLQLSAGFGRVTIPTNLGDIAPIAPSPIQHRWLDVTCREITVDEIKYIVKKFGESAAIGKRAGFDGIEIHAVHEGYLLDQFAMSLFNKRTDEYGGSLKNRLRFAIEILKEIKKTCGEDYPVILRYSLKSFIKKLRVGALPNEKFEEKGRDIEEGIEAIKILEEAGYDAFDVDAGTYDSWYWNHPPMYQKKGLYLPFAKICKDSVKVPIITAGRMDNPDLADKAVKEGLTDFISLGRPMLADPDIVNKIKVNDTKSIRPCLSCQEGCMGRLQEYCALGCAVNPACCRENDMRITKAETSKTIAIVGGGVAGCEAARVLSKRGHKVTLFEKSLKLGGNLLPGGAPDFKEDDRALVAWYENELKKLKVTIKYNTDVDKDMLKKLNADAVIIATGSTPKIFSLGNNSLVSTAEQILMGKKDPGKKTVVIGGGLVGCETALMLAKKGSDVTIVEALPDILYNNGPTCSANSQMLRDLIPFNGISVLANSKVLEATDKSVIVEKDGEKKEIPVDSIILSVGYNSDNNLYESIKDDLDNVYLLGDAKKVSNIMYSIWDAFELCRTF
ncbi:MAG: FAD-dependent oxidoreductase [Clostridium sp.]|nr:FAD-dependent oxidoreductase [Clostridium sp.]